MSLGGSTLSGEIAPLWGSSMTNSRGKGKTGELEAVHLWLRWFPKARRGLQFRNGIDAPDVAGTPYWIEVKRYGRMYPCVWAAAWNQANAAMIQACEMEMIPDLMPVLVMARSNYVGWEIMTDALTLYQEIQFEGVAQVFRHKDIGETKLYRIRWAEFEIRMDIKHGVLPEGEGDDKQGDSIGPDRERPGNEVHDERHGSVQPVVGNGRASQEPKRRVRKESNVA
jgi:hypothetical protein